MKFTFIFLLIFFISSASALQFSPSQLEFALGDGTTECRDIYVETETPTKLEDVWAESYSSEWRVSLFDEPGESFGLQSSYPTSIPAGENDITLCITGENPQFAKGALVFKQEQRGNSLIQFAIWIDVSATQDTDGVDDSNEDSGGGSGSGDGLSGDSSDDDLSSGSSGGSSRRSSRRLDISSGQNFQPVSFERDAPAPKFFEAEDEPIVLGTRNEFVEERRNIAPLFFLIVFGLINLLLLIILLGKVYK